MKPKLTLPRAYLRMSPNLDQHPDPGGMVILICAANRQPQRGRFRDRETLARILGPARLRRFLDRQDIVLLGGWYYVEGWDEWQEGDLTVGERQARIRNRKRDLVTAESRPDNAPNVTQPLLSRAAPSEAVDVPTHVGRRETERTNETPVIDKARPLSLVDPMGRLG